MVIRFEESGMRIAFRVNEDKTVELVDFSAAPESREMPCQPGRGRQFLGVQVTGENASGTHGDKHDCGSASDAWRYVEHTIRENEAGRLFTLSVETESGLSASYYMQLYKNIAAVRTWCTVTNTGILPIGLEFVSSFTYAGIGKNRLSDTSDLLEIQIPHNSWCSEAQFERVTARDAGLSHLAVHGYNLPDRGFNRLHYGSVNSWSSSEYLPLCMIRDPESGEIWYGQIEHSGGWTVEYGQAWDRSLYISLLGPSEANDWWKELAPGESFTTVPAAFGVCVGDVSQAAAELTRVRRALRRPNEDDQKLNIVFNDYMNCLFGDPTEEKEKEIIDRAAALGCEYYCVDAGWYDAGPWWDKVGEWRESPERFPHGLKALFDYGRSKGLKMGMWLEIEVMGVACPLAAELPDSWFITTHGKRRIENKRYLLDFRNPDVRAYCRGVIDRLIAELGAEYFKIDYNVTTGPGSDVGSDSRGQAMLEHYRAYYQWLEEIYRDYPHLVIENCGSGAQRMDYGILRLHSLQSTSDQTDYISNAYIAANVAAAVTPEQAGMWVYPYADDREHVIFNLVNGLLLRPYISGRVWDMCEDQMTVLKEGIGLYASIRGRLKNMTPFFPLGFSRLSDSALAYGVQDADGAYLSCFAIESDTMQIPLNALSGRVISAKPIYPASGDCSYVLSDDALTIRFPQKACARLFELKFAPL